MGRVPLGVVIAAITGCTFQPPAPRDAESPDDGWWDDAWQHRVRITVGNPIARLEGFAALIRVPASVGASVRADGGDLRFVDDAGVELAHDLDHLVPEGMSMIWVQIPVLEPAPLPKSSFWLYYGNPAATSTANPAAVWRDQVSVHHLASLEDASMQRQIATAQGAPVTPGAIGDGRVFAGNDAITLADEPAYDFTTSLAVSVWIDVDVLDAVFQAVVVKGDRAWRLHRDGGNEAIGFGTTSNAQNQDLAGVRPITTPGWHHIAAVYDQGSKSLYVDGQLDSTVPWALAIDNTDVPVVIGRNDQEGPRYFKGAVDELRISAGPRSAAWLDAEFRTVTDPTFVTFEAPQ